MGGYWMLVFACCLLVQSLSAEDSVKDNSTSEVKHNATSEVKHNSTSEVKDNSTSEVKDNPTSEVRDDTSSEVKDNSTSQVKDDSTSQVKDDSTSEVTDDSTSEVNPDEELEKNIGQRIASLRKIGQDEIRNFADFALQYYNTQEASLFTALEGATVTVKKAIGSMVYLRMTLEKTNCTKKHVNHRGLFRIWSPFDDDEAPPKYCEPLSGHDKEQLDCRFDIFKNERSYGESIVGHDCKPVKVIDREIFNGEETQS